jgi:glycosyltransferase involved in cell wall biosynthesis
VHVPLGHLVRRKWRRQLDAMKERASALNVEMHVLPSPPTRMRWLCGDAGRLERWVATHYGEDRVVLHCRNAVMTQIAVKVRSRLPNLRIIYDRRGAEVSELAQRQRAAREISYQTAESLSCVRSRRRIEDEAVHGADHILCVSEAMRRDLEARYAMAAGKSTVVPCCFEPVSYDENRCYRNSVRHELGIAHQTVVAYSGSLSWYQLPQASLRIVRLLQDCREDVHLFAITTNPQQMQREIQQAGLRTGRWSVLSVPPAEVPRYLVAADMALLLRDDTLVNRVASPVKFAEYMAAGLPVLITPNLGDYSEAVCRHRLGTVLRLQMTDADLTDRLSEFVASADFRERRMSERCVRFATDRLSWAKHLPTVLGIYHRLHAETTALNALHISLAPCKLNN